jgi:hypothetical protein
MIEVIKKKNLDGTNVVFLRAEEGDFVFTFCGNLDLYFGYFGKDYRKKEEHSFTVGEKDFFLYRCFGEVYDAIRNEKPYQNGKGHYDFVLEQKHLKIQLLKDGVVEWHSEEGDYNESAVLYIEKLAGAYKVTIKEGMINDSKVRTAYIRFRNKFSDYGPYNSVFMELYNKICEHNFEYEQITLDEYTDKTKIRTR